jgi:nitronate monooxygenase
VDEVIVDELSVPIVLAPLAGGPATPELAAAVSGAGGLGFIASGYLSASDTEAQIAAARQLVAGPFGVNVFAPGVGPAAPAVYASYVERLQEWAQRSGLELGEPRYSDDDWEAKLELLTRRPVEVVSFTFGCPEPEVIRSLRAAGSEVWVTVTNPEEAVLAEAAGADVLVVQGAEAGGHRGSFTDRPDLPVYGLLALIQVVCAAVSLPVVATGGIGAGSGLAAVLTAGARAGQLGSAFMLCPEAGTSQAHRVAFKSGRPTALTRAFTGRLARGIHNGFMSEHDAAAPIAYPEIHYVTARLRARAREQANPELVNLWAGEAYGLAREAPAAEIVERLHAEALKALGRA